MGSGNGLGGSLGSFLGGAEEKTERGLSLLSQIVDKLDDVVQNTQEQVYEEQYLWVQGQGKVAAAGTDVEVEIPAPFPGSAYLINQIAVTGAVNGPVAVYFDQRLVYNLVYFIDNGQIYSDSGVDIYVPQNRKLLFHFYGQVANQNCTVNVQAKRFTQKP